MENIQEDLLLSLWVLRSIVILKNFHINLEN